MAAAARAIARSLTRQDSRRDDMSEPWACGSAICYLIRRFKVFHPWLLIVTAGVVTVSLVAALSGVDVARCLVILMLAPTVTVVGSEVRVAETPSP